MVIRLPADIHLEGDDQRCNVRSFLEQGKEPGRMRHHRKVSTIPYTNVPEQAGLTRDAESGGYEAHCALRLDRSSFGSSKPIIFCKSSSGKMLASSPDDMVVGSKPAE